VGGCGHVLVCAEVLWLKDGLYALGVELGQGLRRLGAELALELCRVAHREDERIAGCG
jgi:hypothetical protein